MADDERAFAAALSEATASLPSAGVSNLLIPSAYADHGENALVAALGLYDMSAGGHPVSLISFGVHYHGDRVRGGRLHNQLYSVSEETPSLALDAEGSMDALADQTAQWFGLVLNRPVVLYVWLHERYAYAARYAFADTSETLCQTYSKERAPEGQYESVIADGHVRGKGWLQTSGLPSATLCLHIRGDREKAKVSAEIRWVQERGPLPGLWYE